MRGYHICISIQRQPETSKLRTNSADVFVPTHLFHQLPAHKPKPTSRRNALFNPADKDYRFGPIRLDWVDFELTNKAPYTTMGKEREGRGSFFGCRLSQVPIYPSQKLSLFLTRARNLGLQTSQKVWSMCSETHLANLRKKNLK
jgi:hypothetical protein